jgi:hypothetical protein
MKKFIASFIFLILFCSQSSPANAALSPAAQFQTACWLVQDWPIDIVKVWPKAVAFHNKVPKKNAAADYMKSKSELTKQLFKLTDKKALNIIQGYEAYWTQLESDYNNNNGKQPGASSPSTQVLSMLMTMCKGVKPR